MKIGLYFSAEKSNGGIYQYSLSILEALAKSGHSLTIFNFSSDLKLPPEVRGSTIIDLRKDPSRAGQAPVRGSWRWFIFSAARQLSLWNIHFPSTILRLRKEKGRAALVDAQHLDFILFPNDADVSIVCKTPVIASIHDLQHRINPQFPEIRADLKWRDYFFSKLAERATLLLADSEVGKQYITEFYPAAEGKVGVLSYLPPDYLELPDDQERRRVIKELSLPAKFFFYPAQLWPHKNHLNIIEAMRILKSKDMSVSLVLSGSKKDQWRIYEAMIEKVQSYGLEGAVRYVGYVDNATMCCLYTNATGLVMPTFFGPSNIPILEAWKLGCPVIYSNIRGCREQAGDAALLCDPKDPQSIADAMQRLWTDESLGKELAARGQMRLSQWTKEDFYRRINALLNDLP